MSSGIVVPVVIDTNILVPSLYRSTPVLKFVLAGNLVVVWNQFIYNEAHKIADELWAWYSKKTVVTPRNDIFQLLDMVFQLGHCVPDMPENWPPASQDRDDDPFLWTAVTGKAEYIISHDRRHMIKLETFHNIPIGTPGNFFEWVEVVHPMPGPQW